MNKKLDDEMERIIDILNNMKTLKGCDEIGNRLLDVYLEEFTTKQGLYKELFSKLETVL